MVLWYSLWGFWTYCAVLETEHYNYLRVKLYWNWEIYKYCSLDSTCTVGQQTTFKRCTLYSAQRCRVRQMDLKWTKTRVRPPNFRVWETLNPIKSMFNYLFNLRSLQNFIPFYKKIYAFNPFTRKLTDGRIISRAILILYVDSTLQLSEALTLRHPTPTIPYT